MSNTQPGVDQEPSQEFVSQLGVVSDRELSKRLGLSTYYVKLEREARGIPAFSHVFVFPKEAQALLGYELDTVISERFSIPLATVYRHRVSLGLPRFKKPTLPENITQLLGTCSDTELARRFALSVYHIQRARNALHIPAFVKQKPASKKSYYKSVAANPQHSWSAEELALLGTISDAKMAKRTGIPIATCSYKRIKLGIKPYRSYKWTPELTALLGKVPDAEVVRQSKGLFNIKGVRKKRCKLGIDVCPAPKAKSTGGRAGSPEVLDKLGKMSDYEIARQTGVDRGCITRQRLKLGINSGPRGRKSRIWTAEEEALLGKYSDSAIGKRIGLCRKTVLEKRKLLGIPTYDGKMDGSNDR